MIVMAKFRLAGSNNPEMSEARENFPDRLQIKRRSNVANYPAGAAFSKSTYKIYAVCRTNRYKSNIFFDFYSAGWNALNRLEIAGRRLVAGGFLRRNAVNIPNARISRR